MFPESLNIWEIQNSKSSKPHILQDSPLVQLYASGSECIGDGNTPGSHFMKAFQLFLCIRNDVSSITKAPSIQCWFQSREQVKQSADGKSGEYGGMLQYCHIAVR